MASVPDTTEVVLLVLPESTPASVYSMHEVFSAVGTAWTGLTGRPDTPKRLIRPLIASRDGRTVRSPVGPPVFVERSLDKIDRADVVIVTDLAIDTIGDPRAHWLGEAAWVRERFAEGAVVCSVCTGTVFLAAAGLLDGSPATTHWAVVPVFRERFPRVKLQTARILCPAGPEHRIVTAGGASSWGEMALYLIARFCGMEEARRIARVFLLGDHSDGQLPFAAMARPRQHDDGLIARTQYWIASHYAAANPVARMAEHTGLPERTFARRFRKATGYSPMEYVQALRIEEAKQMLEATDQPTDAISIAVGYEDPASFRRLFGRLVGVTPARYRKRFRSIGVA